MDGWSHSYHPIPQTPTHHPTHRVALRAFEAWAHDPKSRKHLAASDRVMTALVTLVREDEARLAPARRHGGHAGEEGDPRTALLGMLASLGKVSVLLRVHACL